MSEQPPNKAFEREVWISRARLASFAVLLALVGLAAWRFIGPGDDGDYASRSLRAVRVTVEGPAGQQTLIVPRAYLLEAVGNGATVRGEIGRPALSLLAANTLAPCRLTSGCEPGQPGSIRIGAPYPYDFAADSDDAAGPDAGRAENLTDLPGFSLKKSPGAVGGEPGGFRTEVREYRPWRAERVKRVRCNLLVGPNVEVGDCEAVAAWRDGWLIQIVVDVKDLKGIEAAADGAADLLDQLRAPEPRRS